MERERGTKKQSGLCPDCFLSLLLSLLPLMFSRCGFSPYLPFPSPFYMCVHTEKERKKGNENGRRGQRTIQNCGKSKERNRVTYTSIKLIASALLLELLHIIELRYSALLLNLFKFYYLKPILKLFRLKKRPKLNILNDQLCYFHFVFSHFQTIRKGLIVWLSKTRRKRGEETIAVPIFIQPLLLLHPSLPFRLGNQIHQIVFVLYSIQIWEYGMHLCGFLGTFLGMKFHQKLMISYIHCIMLCPLSGFEFFGKALWVGGIVIFFLF